MLVDKIPDIEEEMWQVSAIKNCDVGLIGIIKNRFLVSIVNYLIKLFNDNVYCLIIIALFNKYFHYLTILFKNNIHQLMIIVTVLFNYICGYLTMLFNNDIVI